MKIHTEDENDDVLFHSSAANGVPTCVSFMYSEIFHCLGEIKTEKNESCSHSIEV